MRLNATKSVLLFNCKIMLSERSAEMCSFLSMEAEMTKQWFKCAGIRAIKTVSQTAIAMIGTSVVISDVNWLTVVSASILAGVLSLLTSLAGLPEVNEEK